MRSDLPESPGSSAGDPVLLNAALESMPYGFSIWDEGHRLLLWNQRYLTIYHLPPERIRRGMSLEELCSVTVEAGNHPGKPASDLYATYLGWLNEVDVDTKEIGHEKIIRGRIIRSTYLRARSLGWVVTHEDITDRKKQIELFAEREAELEKQNVRFKAAVDNMSHALCMFDADQRLIICNRQYQSLYHLPAGLTQPGTSLSDILAYRIEHGIFSIEGKETISRAALTLLPTRSRRPILSRSVTAAFSRSTISPCPMADGYRPIRTSPNSASTRSASAISLATIRSPTSPIACTSASIWKRRRRV
jgi:PAS domain-containing protein